MYTRQEAASRAGFTVEEVTRIVELGIIEPSDGDTFSSGDVRRMTMVHNLVSGVVHLLSARPTN